MRTVGIVAEYNPFHQGHAGQIREIRKKLPGCGIVAAMSGDFVQRGEPAVFDKYVRTRMALEGGVDLVAEIPAACATATAEDFARAGVGLLEGLGCDTISFGMEADDEEELFKLAGLFVSQPPEYRQALKAGLRQGMNYPAARQKAAAALAGDHAAHLLASPNNILAIEYRKAMIRSGSAMAAFPVRRRGGGYHDLELSSDYPSAAAIRKGLSDLKKGKLSGRERKLAEEAMGPRGPEYVMTFLSGETVSWRDLIPYLKYQLNFRDLPVEDYLGMQADMARRIEKASLEGETIREIIEELHTRAFTDAALKRALLHVVLKMGKNLVGKERPSYARILGFSDRGKEILGRARESGRMIIIQKPSLAGKLLGEDRQSMDLFDADICTEYFYERLAAGHTGRKAVHPLKREQVRLQAGSI